MNQKKKDRDVLLSCKGARYDCAPAAIQNIHVCTGIDCSLHALEIALGCEMVDWMGRAQGDLWASFHPSIEGWCLPLAVCAVTTDEWKRLNERMES